jgi:adenylate kinase family enzyme
MQRVIIVGTTGSGKSVLAQRLEKRIDAVYVDLDALHWEQGWQEAPSELFRARVAEALQVERWVVAGNYSEVRDLIWSKGDTLIWLDYGLRIIFWRLLRRTVKRIVTKEELWDTGNYETWRTQFFSRDSLFLWVLRSRPQQRLNYPQVFQQLEYRHLHTVRLCSPRETEAWMKHLCSCLKSQGEDIGCKDETKPLYP